VRESAGQLLRFSAVGTVGFLVDAGILQGLLTLGLDPYTGRLLSYLAAATTTWVFNRRFTFRIRGGEGLVREWLHYLVANGIGGLLNYATYTVLLLVSDLMRAWPVLAVAVGSGVGLTFNFVANKYVVFRRHLAER
jgi:putative flippase GtrA